MTPVIICPHDRHALEVAADGMACAGCGRVYPVTDGVVCTLDAPDAFYEGAYENQTHFVPRSEKPWHVWPLWLISSGYLWTVRRLVPAGATVVELGCAGGVRYFGRRYRMIGCDLSFGSLRRVTFYERLLQADAGACIPLPDRSVDAVVSSYFWEHIPPAVKPRILRECRRVLRPGGALVFLYDVETDNPLIRPFKRAHPDRYQRLFLDEDGHLGYQRPEDNRRGFEEAGFEVLAHAGLEKTCLQSPSTYDKLARFGGRGRRWFARLSGLGRPPLVYPYTALVRLTDTAVGWLLPSDWARIALVACRRRR